MPDLNPRPNPVRRSIFAPGLAFTLDTFSSREFIVKDFIESLSDAAINGPSSTSTSSSTARRRSGTTTHPNQPFDPKPLIRTFEAAQRRLVEISGDLEIRENELSAAVRRAEAQHAGNVSSLGRKLKVAIESFRELDVSLNGPGGGAGSIGGIGSTAGGKAVGSGTIAIETGKRLEELDRQRRRAKDAHFLIECWDEVCNRGQLTRLEGLRRGGSGEGKVASARIARQLLRISQRLDPASWSEANGGGANGEYRASLNVQDTNAVKTNTREIIEKFLEALEKDLLKQFDDFYRKANFDGMRDCATVLYDFNGGASVIGLFVNQHQFFIDRSQLITDEVGGDAETWEQLADPDANPPGVEPSLQSLVDEVKEVVQEESTIIKRAFPFYEQVLGRFLQRVFQQSIQQRLEMVLEKAASVSSLAYLRSLQTARSCISGLIDDLKMHGLTEHPETISSQTSMMLDQQLEELFVPYLVGSSYMEREKKNLEELYTSLLFKFVTFHARRKKSATTFMSSLAKSGSELLASARDAYISRLESSDFTPTQRRMLLRVARLKDTEEAQRQNEIELSDADGQLSVDFTKRMLKWLAEGVGRGLEIGVSSDTPKDVSALLNMLLTVMVEGYIETALEAALEAASAQESGKTEPDFTYLNGLRTAISVTHLMMTCINTVLIPLAAGNITIRRDMEKKTAFATNRIEEKINAIEQKTIDVALAWIARVLSGQKKNDFRPKEGAGEGASWLEMLQTPVSRFLWLL